MSQHLVRHITAASVRRSTGLNRRVFAQMQRENAGVHGPFLVHASQPTLLAAVWALFRETQLAGGVPRAHQETIALLVAEENRCPWCIEAHELALQTQPRVPEVVAWYSAHPDPLEATPHPAFTPETFVAHRAAVLLWQYINRITNVLLVDSAWQRFGSWRAPLTRVMGRVFGAFFLHRRYEPGRALVFVSDAPLPKHLAWARPHRPIAAALAYFHQQIQQIGTAHIPPTVQGFVLEFVRAHRGQIMGLSRRWADDAVELLESDQRPLAKLLVLTALASYQIDDVVVQSVRASLPTDADLLAVLAWGSYAVYNRPSSLEVTDPRISN
jgi:alkylhydroperoxidase family enzyme